MAHSESDVDAVFPPRTFQGRLDEAPKAKAFFEAVVEAAIERGSTPSPIRVLEKMQALGFGECSRQSVAEHLRNRIKAGSAEA